MTPIGAYFGINKYSLLSLSIYAYLSDRLSIRFYKYQLTIVYTTVSKLRHCSRSTIIYK